MFANQERFPQADKNVVVLQETIRTNARSVGMIPTSLKGTFFRNPPSIYPSIAAI
jgi:hypothetical protein